MEWVKVGLDFLARVSWPLAVIIIGYWLLFKKGAILQRFLDRTKTLKTPIATFEQAIEQLGNEAAEVSLERSAIDEKSEYSPEEIRALLKDAYKIGAISAGLISGELDVGSVAASASTPDNFKSFLINKFPISKTDQGDCTGQNNWKLYLGSSESSRKK